MKNNNDRTELTYHNKNISELLSTAKKDFSIAGKITYELFSLKLESKAIEFLAKFIEDNNHLYSLRNDEKTEVWIYHDGIYVQQGKTIIKEQLRKILGSGMKIKYLPDILLRIELDTMIDIEEFFSHISSEKYLHLIPIKNGIFNINTKKLEKFNPKIIFTTKIPISYNPKATCPKIEGFIQGVFETDNP